MATVFCYSFALPDGYEERYYEGMLYGLFVPDSYDSTQSYPLVLYLHGCNDVTAHDLDLYHIPVQAKNPCFVLTPKGVNMIEWCDAWGNSWQSEHTPDMLKVLAIIDSLELEFNIDVNRLHVYGISMGSFGTFSLLAKNPDMFASAFAICGGGNILTAVQVAKTPLWIFHGDADPMVPVEQSRTMYNAITNAGGTQVRYTEYPGVDHDAWEPALNEPTLYPWLFAHVRGQEHSLPDNAENFEADLTKDSHVNLAWSPPSDKSDPDNQVWYYKIFRDDTLIAEVDNILNSYVDSLNEEAAISLYRISAVNYFFKESVLSESISVHELSSPFFTNGNPLKLRISFKPGDHLMYISFTLNDPGIIKLLLCDVNGRMTTILDNTYCHDGLNEISWNTDDIRNGIYFCKIITSEVTECQKLFIMK